MICAGASRGITSPSCSATWAAAASALLRLAGRHLFLTGTDHYAVRGPIAIFGLDAILECRSTVTTGSEKSSA
jgi:hypothetical protein